MDQKWIKKDQKMDQKMDQKEVEIYNLKKRGEG